MKADTSKLPSGVQELQKMIRQMEAVHEKELRGLQENLQKERNERIEQQNKALEYFEKQRSAIRKCSIPGALKSCQDSFPIPKLQFSSDSEIGILQITFIS